MGRCGGFRWNSWVWIVPALLLALPDVSGASCACIGAKSPVIELERASAVFSGLVIDQFPMLPCAPSDTTVSSLLVERVWKGDLADTVRVSTTGLCAYRFTIGTRYLVYARSDDSTLFTSICYRTAPVASAGDDIDSLPAPTRTATWSSLPQFSVRALTEQLRSGDSAERHRAARTLAQIGEDLRIYGVRGLLDLIRTSRSDDERAATDALRRINDPSGLGHGGPHREVALLALLASEWPDTCVRNTSMRALGNIGPEARWSIPYLISALSDHDAGVRATAAEALARVGQGDSATAHALIATLADPVPEVRSSVAVSIAQVRAEPERSVAGLIARLDDDDGRVRKLVIWALGEFRGDANVAVPALLLLLEHEIDDDTRLQVESALIDIDPDRFAAPRGDR